MTLPAPLTYCPDLLAYTRRPSREVWVGHLGLGAQHPVRVQSMITADTRDTPACVAEILALAAVGCELVRITAQTKTYAANLQHIAREVRAAGCQVPLVADIHFKPDAAMEAAKWVEKVRVNPGNYSDSKKFAVRDYDDAQYLAELERIRAAFAPLVRRCKQLGRAMRIGTNHGSLSDRIMNRYGDTPLGMVESALEFARIARDDDYHQLVFSMKASNPKVMIEAYRLLVARLAAEGPDWNYPIHLGVTEAGDGEDGRIKSAIGIGSLLADGIGDTIRVSLTEDSIHEIPVAQALVRACTHGSASDGTRGYASDGTRGCGVPPQSVMAASRGQSEPSRCLSEDASSIHIDWEKVQKTTATYLPHWKLDGGTYAVTFRLADSLPSSVLDHYRHKRKALFDLLESHARAAGSRSALEQMLSVRHQLAQLQAAVIDPELDRGHGSCLFRDDGFAGLVAGALRHFDGLRYTLLAWCVMPNHVHAVLKPAAGYELQEILHSWKSFTAHEMDKRLGAGGTIWQKESYDHLIRDGEDLRNQVEYVLDNPGKAGLDGWEWAGCAYPELAARRREHGLWRAAAATAAAYDPFSYERRGSSVVTVMGHELGGDRTLRVFTTQERWNAIAHKIPAMGDFKPEIILEQSGVRQLDPRDDAAIAQLNAVASPQLVTVADGVAMEVIHAFRLLAARAAPRHPILLKDTLGNSCGSSCGFQPHLTFDCQQRFIDPTQPIEKHHATFLPHWTQQGGVYAITFRLANSIPSDVLESYRRDRAQLENDLACAKLFPDPTASQHQLADLTNKLALLYESSIGAALDAGTGPCHLRDERVATLVLDALRHFDGQRYRLLAWCIMPNHVHLIIQPLEGRPLAEILHSIKSFTGTASNQLLGMAGAFWHKEYYDHLIRDGGDYRDQLRYVLQNPENARLVNWPWKGSVYGDSWEAAKKSSQGDENQELRLEAATTAATTAATMGATMAATMAATTAATTATITAARNLGSLLCDGIGDAIIVRSEPAPGRSLQLAYNILQAAGSRIFKTDYVACPSCGRTLFNLQHTTQKIRTATGHLKGVRIAVMGCIVNGPGEMADADFGYVGGAPGKINLYVGKTAVQFNIPERDAVARLTDLIRAHGKWVEPPPVVASLQPI